MNTRRINPTIHEINDTITVMERQWGEPYRRYSVFTAILIAGVLPWALGISAVWVALRGY